MKKIFLFLVSILALSASRAAGPIVTTVILSTGATQNGGMHTSTGTVDNFRASTITLSGSALITGSSLTFTNVTGTNATFTDHIALPLGSLGNSSLQYLNNAGLGIYFPTTNSLAFQIGSLNRLVLDLSSFTTSVPIQASDGTAANPSHSFFSTPNLGSYRKSGNIYAISSNATEIFRLDTSSVVTTVPFQTSAGSLALPSHSFLANTNTGWLNNFSNQMQASAGGVSAEIIASTGVWLQGTTTNNNAIAGGYGEYVSSSVITSINLAATGGWGNIISTTVAAGDWDVGGSVIFDLNGATATQMEVAISALSGGATGDQVAGQNDLTEKRAFGATDQASVTIANFRESLSATTTIYLKALGVYSAGTPRITGCFLALRRAR